MLRCLALALLALQPPAPPRDVAPPSQAAERYVIRGRVTDVATGQPLRGVAISIRSSGEGAGLAQGALTDDEGRWSFTGLPTGDYILNHGKPGFTRVQGVRIYSPVHVSAQFPVRDLELVLARGGVISGRVTDPMGEPAVQVQVQAHRVIQGQPSWSEHQDTTDDRGEFRLFGLMPGEYAVSATPQRGHEIAVTPERGRSPIMTYYPGTVQAAEAERLVIAEQGAVSDLTFQLQTARTFVISGQVVASSPHVTDGFVTLDQTGSSRGSSVDGWGRSGGRFRIADVLPGEYTVSAHVRLEDGEEHGEVSVVVGDEDVTVTIVTQGPTVIRGRVVPLSGPLRDLDGLMVGAWGLARERRSQGRPGRVREDGTFEATTTAASSFRVQLVNRGGLSTGWRQKEVRWRGERVGKEGITAPGPVVEGIEVVIVAATARLQGTARDAAGAAMREGTVVIVPAEDVAEGFPMWHRAVITEGRFVSPPVPEGRYLVAAVPAVAPGQITPDVVAQVRERGESVELGDRELRTIALTAVVDTPR